MLKKALCGRLARGSNRYVTKTLLVMKLTMILLTAAIVQVSAKGLSQTVSFNGKNIPLQEVLSAVEKQTGFFVACNEVLLDKAKPVTLNVTEVPLKDFLQQVFKDQPLDYSINNTTIAVFRKQSMSNGTINVTGVDAILPPSSLIRGRVLDANGAPLAGATVMLKGGKVLGVTNAEGVFSVNVSVGDVLVISSVGFESTDYKISSAVVMSSDQQSTPGTGVSLTITLKRKESQLDEIQVIAYGTKSKRLQTGDVTTVKAADISKAPVDNVLLALVGRVPGLEIQQASGQPGSGITIRVQGQNSLLQGNDPLIVVDGIPYPSQLLATIGTHLGSSGGVVVNGLDNGSGSSLSFLNPADIESIDVLKDADATSIYGSRAANGAILITTKKGKVGPTRFSVRAQNGWGKVTRNLDVLDRRQYLDMRYEAFKNDNIDWRQSSVSADDLKVWDTTRSTDWQKELIGGTAKYTDIQTSVSGGTPTTQFLLGAGFHKEGTVFPGDFSDKKGSLHVSLNNTSANQKFRLQLQGTYLVDVNNISGADLTNTAVHLSPVAPALYNSDGSLNWAPKTVGQSTQSTWTNPLAYLLRKYRQEANNLVSNLMLSYKLLPGLDIKSSFGYNMLRTDEYISDPVSATPPESRPGGQNRAFFGRNKLSNYIIEPQATYNLKIGDGTAELLAGSTIQQNTGNILQVTGIGYTTELLMEDLMAAPTVSVNRTDATTYKYRAIFGRINYNWKNKYILNLNARRDGSSRFGFNNHLHNFWSVGGAWIISDEPFVKKSVPFLSFVKLRGSYGTIGSDQIGDYQYLSQFMSAGYSYQGVTGLEPDRIANPNLAWEETKKMQLGLDLGFFSDRLLLNVNYFRNRSSNQLIPYKLPSIAGFESITSNFPATIQNAGFELSARSQNIVQKDFNWSTSANITIRRSKIAEFPNIELTSYSNSIIGESLNLILRFHYLGVNPTTGLYEFADKDGNKTSSPNNSGNSPDKTVKVDFNPTFSGGLQNSITYKGIQLDFLLQFAKQIADADVFGFSYRPGRFFGVSNFGNQPATVLDRWQKPGDVATVQKFSTRYPSDVLNAWRAAGASDAAFSDASYIRLRNLSLSWQFPQRWYQRIHMQNARIFMQGQNLLTFTKYEGMDPETKNSGSLPPLRTITFGLEFTL